MTQIGACQTADSAQPVQVAADGVRLEGDLGIPQGAQGIVIFAHGSGSSRLSPRNRFVGGVLREAGLATLLLDLLTLEEERANASSYRYRFDIALLTRRLVGATDWALHQPETEGLGIGYFGTSTGAAAALAAAAQRPGSVQAVVPRGGRPDLAAEALSKAKAPTLLIVGGKDTEVLRLNQAALAHSCLERKSSRWCPMPAICSRSQAPWKRSRPWRADGSCATSGNQNPWAHRPRHRAGEACPWPPPVGDRVEPLGSLATLTAEDPRTRAQGALPM